MEPIMSEKATSRLAWVLCGLAVIGATAQLVSWTTRISARPDLFGLVEALGWGMAIPIVFAVLGALIVARQGGNRVGWLMMIVALASANPVSILMDRLLSAPPETLSLGLWLLLWLDGWSWIPLIFPIFLIPLHFPTRYRLYDIDVVIRKTLVYCGADRAAGAGLLRQSCPVAGLFSRLAGVEQSTLAVVISTLAIAALFTPLRRRIQDAIDRRFYRKKYNAQQVLAQFAQTARDETDLDALLAELVRVVDETLQPEHVSVWLRNKKPRRAHWRLRG
jgi:hypothetical protein